MLFRSTAVYHAVRPADPVLVPIGPGTNVVDGRGGNTFSAGAGSHAYLSLTDERGLTDALETLLATRGERAVAYLSPHLEQLEERIRVDGAPIAASRLQVNAIAVAPFARA